MTKRVFRVRAAGLVQAIVIVFLTTQCGSAKRNFGEGLAGGPSGGAAGKGGATLTAGTAGRSGGTAGANSSNAGDTTSDAGTDGGPTCGNGSTEGAETCDDGNTKSGDGCSADCVMEVGSVSGGGAGGGGAEGGRAGGGVAAGGNDRSGDHAGGSSGGGSSGMSSAGTGGAGMNPCAANPCVNGACAVNGASYTCVCTPGFTGTRCELPRFQPIPISVAAGVVQQPEDVSGDGSTIVGEATDFVSSTHIFRWSAAGGLEDLSSRVLLPFALSGSSLDGSVLVGSNAAGVFRWPTMGAPQEAPIPAGTVACGYTARISSDGSTLIGGCNSVDHVLHAVRWRVAGTVLTGERLPEPSGGHNSYVFDVNSNGTAMVGSVDGGGVVRWTEGATGLVMQPLFPGTLVRGMSADGEVVLTDAERWTQAGGLEILRPPTLPAIIHAWDISDDGLVIVGTLADPGDSFTEALLWNLSGVHYVRDLLIAAGVPPSAMLNWKLGYASAVSGDGKVIAGAGTNPNGLLEAWIARLP